MSDPGPRSAAKRLSLLMLPLSEAKAVMTALQGHLVQVSRGTRCRCSRLAIHMRSCARICMWFQTLSLTRAAEGRSLLVLLPSEAEAMVAALQGAKVPLQQTKVNPSKTAQSLTPALQSLMSKSPELKVGRLAVSGAVTCIFVHDALCAVCMLADMSIA